VDCLGIVRRGTHEIILVRISAGAVEKGAGTAGIKPNRLTIVRDRTVIVFLGDLHIGTVAKVLHRAWIESIGRIEIR